MSVSSADVAADRGASIRPNQAGEPLDPSDCQCCCCDSVFPDVLDEPDLHDTGALLKVDAMGKVDGGDYFWCVDCQESTLAVALGSYR